MPVRVHTHACTCSSTFKCGEIALCSIFRKNLSQHATDCRGVCYKRCTKQAKESRKKEERKKALQSDDEGGGEVEVRGVRGGAGEQICMCEETL